MSAFSHACGTLVLAFACALLLLPSPAAGQGTAFTYQGYLEEGGAPAIGTYDLRFILYDSDVGGSQVGDMAAKDDVSVTEGVFATSLDFGTAFDSGALRYLELGVRNGGSTGAYTILSPREPLRPAPGAIVARRALSLPNVTVDGSGNVGIGTTSPSSLLTVAGAIETTTGGIVFPDGTTQTSAGAAPGNVWMIGGNARTDPSAGDYIGTSDDTPLELRVGGMRALRVEPATDRNGNVVPNVIGGHPSNGVSDGTFGVTISGGGFDNGSIVRPNRVEASLGTVGGGYGNTTRGLGATISGGIDNSAGGANATVAGGTVNFANGSHAVVGGGSSNVASGFYATASGGQGNTASDQFATVGGGSSNAARDGFATVSGGDGNIASGTYAAVGGGIFNTASGNDATVPGGRSNEARGPSSFAAGYYARVRPEHGGTFVWSDNSQPQADSLVSTGANQFLIRAGGGVGIGTNSPLAQLHVKNDDTSTLARLEGSGRSRIIVRDDTRTTFTIVDSRGFSNDRIELDAPNGNINIDGNFSSSGADYAELLPLRGGTAARPGDLVGVTGGAVGLVTGGAERLMIVSTDPAILGNKDAEGAVPVAFLGQVPVRVRGPVAIGDLLVASGQSDGTARAVAASEWDPDTDGPIAGQAWTAKADVGVGTVTAAVGLSETRALVERLRGQQARIDVQQTRITELEAQVQRLEALHGRLARLEAMLPAETTEKPAAPTGAE